MFFSDVKQSSKLPVLIGSGVDAENFRSFLNADAFIIGSYFKKNGYWENDLDSGKIGAFMQKLKTVTARKNGE